MSRSTLLPSALALAFILTSSAVLSQTIAPSGSNPPASSQDVFLLFSGAASNQQILLTLNNNKPAYQQVSLTLFTAKGTEVNLPAVPLAADQSKIVRLDEILRKFSIDGPLGYLRVRYSGQLMEIGAQLTLYPVSGKSGMDSPRSLTVDFTSTRRSATAWMPAHAHAMVAITNVTDLPITVQSEDTIAVQLH